MVRIPRMSEKEALIMELLLVDSSTPKYGLQLVAVSEGRLQKGTVYVHLARMQRKRFVTSQEEVRDEKASGTPRRLYEATPLGQQSFEAWEMSRHAALNFLAGGGSWE